MRDWFCYFWSGHKYQTGQKINLKKEYKEIWELSDKICIGIIFDWGLYLHMKYWAQ